MTLTELIKDVAKVYDKKIDERIAHIRSKKVLPPSIHVPLIDLTQGGERLTHAEHQKKEKAFLNLATQRDALRLAFSKHDAILIPNSVLDTIRKDLGLLEIQPSSCEHKEGNTVYGWYNILLYEWRSIMREKEKKEKERLSDQYRQVYNEKYTTEFFKKQFEQRLFVPLFWLVVFMISCAISYAMSYSFIPLIVGFSIAYPAYYIKRRNYIEEKKQDSWIDYEESTIDAIEEEAKKVWNKPPLEVLFPDGIIKCTLSEQEISKMRRTGITIGRDYSEQYDLVQVSVPQPDSEKVIDAITDVYTSLAHSGLKNAEVLIISDQKAIGYDVQLMRRKEAPAPVVKVVPIPAMNEDPGMVIRYKEFTVIFPQCFWNITSVEKQLIEKAYDIAESWNAQTYIFN